MVKPSLKEWRRIFNFGGQSAVTNVVTSISMDVNELVLGRLLGFGPVAILSKAQGLMLLFHRDLMTAVRNVAYPAFAKAHREKADMEAAYINAVAMVTAFAWPFYGFLALFHFEVVRIMFGPQWDESAQLVPIFCLAGAAAATCSLAISAMMAVGRIDLVTRTELVFQPLRAVTIVVAVMLFETLQASAIAYLVAFVGSVPFTYYMKNRCIRNDYRGLLRALSESGKVSAFSLLPAILFATLIPPTDDVFVMGMVLVGAGIFCAGFWIVGVFIFRHRLSQEKLLSGIAGKLGRDA
jgi:O-antigen/teichoic acid export membrane protein